VAAGFTPPVGSSPPPLILPLTGGERERAQLSLPPRRGPCLLSPSPADGQLVVV